MSHLVLPLLDTDASMTDNNVKKIKEVDDAEVICAIEGIQIPNTTKNWSDLTFVEKLRRVLIGWIGKCICLISLLYIFVCSLDLLSSAFRLVGGKYAGKVFADSALLGNPVCGLMIGVLSTVIVQSSSTSSSIVVTMVASGILQVHQAVPIIMGANIGTSLTNTIVSLMQSTDREIFRRSFAGATVHDMFNWLSVCVLLPLEIATGYLYHLTSALLSQLSKSCNEATGEGCSSRLNVDFLKTITKPFTKLIVQLDKKVLEGIATNDPAYLDMPLLKRCSQSDSMSMSNMTDLNGNFSEMLISSPSDVKNMTTVEDFIFLNISNSSMELNPGKKCDQFYLLASLSDSVAGVLLLVCSLVSLCVCLVLLVKLLNSALSGPVMSVIKRIINYELPTSCGKYLTGYLAIVVGAILTILVQSSSVFTSALTPLVGVGVISLERVYPLTLGSNIGTTSTGLLAAFAASGGDRLKPALQVALVHLCFNLTGILMFYPIPAMRIPIRLAKMMGETTARYRWFAIAYILFMFLLMPLFVFCLSMLNTYLTLAFVGCTISCVLLIGLINLLQKHKPNILPVFMKNWEFLPVWLRSLEPMDNILQRMTGSLKRLLCDGCKCDCGKASKALAIADEVEVSFSPIYRPSTQRVVINGSVVVIEGIEKLMEDDIETTTTILTRDCDSGYASRTTTPHNTAVNTPCVSRLPSFAALPVNIIQEENEMDEAQAANDPVKVVIEVDDKDFEDNAGGR